MLKDKAGRSQWLPDEIIVHLVEEPDGYAAFAQPEQPEAGVYNPVFSLWDGAPLLDFLFEATDKSNQKNGLAQVLLLDLRLPKAEEAQFLL